MKIWVGIFCACVLWTPNVLGDSFRYDEFGSVVNLNNDSVVYEYVNFEPGVVHVGRSIELLNFGCVDTKFVVCDDCQLRIVNQGDFVANFDLANGASVVQVVSGPDDACPIVGNVKYDLMLDGARGVKLNRIFGDDMVNALVLKDSVIDINDVDFTGLESVVLHGSVVLQIDDIDKLHNVPIMMNVSGNGRVLFDDGNENPLYAVVGSVVDGRLFANRVRVTDYSRILGNRIGGFLDELRNKNPDDSLLYALDSANDMGALHGVINESVRTNPGILMDFARVLGTFSRLDLIREFGVGVHGDFIASDDFYVLGVNADFVDRIGDLGIGLGIRIGDIKYSSNLDVFDGVYYGINLHWDYLVQKNLFIRGVSDFMRLNFDVGHVLCGDEIINNPSVLAIGGVVDFGYKYRLGDSFYVVPFVGIDGYKYVMENISDVFVRGHAGLDVEYTYQMLGIKYDYGFGLGVNSDVAIMATGRVGFWSNYDGAGADIKLSVLRMFDMYSYQVSIGGKVCF